MWIAVRVRSGKYEGVGRAHWAVGMHLRVMRQMIGLLGGRCVPPVSSSHPSRRPTGDARLRPNAGGGKRSRACFCLDQ